MLEELLQSALRLCSPYLSPTFHERSPLLSNALLLFFCRAIGISPDLLRFRLNVLVDVPHAQELRNPWEQRAR